MLRPACLTHQPRFGHWRVQQCANQLLVFIQPQLRQVGWRDLDLVGVCIVCGKLVLKDLAADTVASCPPFSATCHSAAHLRHVQATKEVGNIPCQRCFMHLLEE